MLFLYFSPFWLGDFLSFPFRLLALAKSDLYHVLVVFRDKDEGTRFVLHSVYKTRRRGLIGDKIRIEEAE